MPQEKMCGLSSLPWRPNSMAASRSWRRRHHSSPKRPRSCSLWTPRSVACHHSPDDQTLWLQAGAGEDDVIHLLSGLDYIACERQEEVIGDSTRTEEFEPRVTHFEADPNTTPFYDCMQSVIRQIIHLINICSFYFSEHTFNTNRSGNDPRERMLRENDKMMVKQTSVQWRQHFTVHGSQKSTHNFFLKKKLICIKIIYWYQIPLTGKKKAKRNQLPMPSNCSASITHTDTHTNITKSKTYTHMHTYTHTHMHGCIQASTHIHTLPLSCSLTLSFFLSYVIDAHVLVMCSQYTVQNPAHLHFEQSAKRL